MAIIYALFFFFLWIIFGPLSIFIASAIAYRSGPNEKHLVSLEHALSIAVVLSLVLTALISPSPDTVLIFQMFNPIAEWRIINTFASENLDNQELEIQRVFVMENFGGLLISVFLGRYAAVPGALRRSFQTKMLPFEKRTVAPIPAMIITVLITTFIIFTAYFLNFTSYRWFIGTFLNGFAPFLITLFTLKIFENLSYVSFSRR